MDSVARREQLLKILRETDEAVPGVELSRQLHVSRQVIVQDIALLRATGHEIISTNRGYILRERKQCRRIFKVRHSEAQLEEELTAIVDLGGAVEDVFVYHKIYGVVKAAMGIKSRRDVYEYMENLNAGISTPLMRITDDYHYHTITADSKETLDLIQDMLDEKGFLAQLREYEPVDFAKME